jgi:carbohydrate diacid regulator
LILEHIAQTIVEKTTDIIGYPISITDEKGRIIGSTDPARIGKFHQASLEVLRKNQEICYEPEDVKLLDNVLPGVATPLQFHHHAIGVLGIVGVPNEVKKYSLLVKSYVEMICQESFKHEMDILQTKTLDTLIHYILQYDNQQDEADIIGYAKMLGYNLQVDRICLILDIDINISNLQCRSNNQYSLQYFQLELLDHVRHIFSDHKEDIITLLHLGQFFILKTVFPHETHKASLKAVHYKLDKFNDYLCKNYGSSASISIGNKIKGIEGIRESYENASKAMIIGKRADLHPQIYVYDDWNIMLELISSEMNPGLRKKLIQSVNPLFTHDNYEVFSTTFLAYCKHNLNLSETARVLYVHRNTLVYRLEKISEITNLNTNNFEHSLLLYIAIKSHESSVKAKKT